MLAKIQQSDQDLTHGFERNFNSYNPAAEILSIICQTKAYRIIPIGLIAQLNQYLSDASVSCWLRLYELCHPEIAWSIQLSKHTLANKLHKNSTTTGRLLDELEQNGFIIRKPVGINNVHYASRIFVTLPDSIIQALNDLPNRKQSNASKVLVLADKEPKAQVVRKFYVKHGQRSFAEKYRPKQFKCAPDTIAKKEKLPASKISEKTTVQEAPKAPSGIPILTLNKKIKA